MKFLKVMAMAMFAVAGCTSLVSCGDDDNDEPNNGGSEQNPIVNPSNVFTAGIPKQVGGMSITTGTNGLVTSMSNVEDGVKVTFSYPSVSRAESYDVIMTVAEDGDKYVFNMLLNDAGFAKYCKQSGTDGDGEEWWFEYNADGQLSKMKRTEGGNEVTEISYVDGNITNVKMSSEDDVYEYNYVISYGSPALENKGCLMLFDETFGIDMDEMGYAYFAGLLGKSTKNLPVSNTYIYNGQLYGEIFSWTLNAENLPVALVINYTLGQEEEIGFRW